MPTEQQALVTAFYELTRGHPLALALAVTYFQELPESERTPASLRAGRPLVDDRARVEWLNERLLNRLVEPYRTLLERGPILRSFATIEGASSLDTLDNRAYERFLLYPFINQSHLASDGRLAQCSFHNLLRRVQLGTLCNHHPAIYEQLHHVVADYYRNIIQMEQKQKGTDHEKGGFRK